MKRNWMIVAIAIVLACAVIYYQMEKREARVAADGSAPLLGYAAPSFEMTGTDGATHRVGGAREKPLLLNFWASWCIPCQVEAPDLQELYEAYGDRFDLYGVNVTSMDTRKNAMAMVEEYGFTFPVLFDEDGALADTYQFISIPTSFLIDRNGTIVDVFNFTHREELESKIRDMISNVALDTNTR